MAGPASKHDLHPIVFTWCLHYNLYREPCSDSCTIKSPNSLSHIRIVYNYTADKTLAVYYYIDFKAMKWKGFFPVIIMASLSYNIVSAGKISSVLAFEIYENDMKGRP